MAHALSASDRISEALHEYETILKKNPSLADVHLGMAKALMKKEDLQEARKHLEEALKLNPTYEQALLEMEKIQEEAK